MARLTALESHRHRHTFGSRTLRTSQTTRWTEGCGATLTPSRAWGPAKSTRQGYESCCRFSLGCLIVWMGVQWGHVRRVLWNCVVDTMMACTSCVLGAGCAGWELRWARWTRQAQECRCDALDRLSYAIVLIGFALARCDTVLYFTPGSCGWGGVGSCIQYGRCCSVPYKTRSDGPPLSLRLRYTVLSSQYASTDAKLRSVVGT